MMAKKKHKKKVGSRRRRRVGGLNLKSDTIQMALGVVAANVGSRFLGSAITKSLSTMSTATVGWITAGGEIAGGYLLGTKSKSPIMKGAAIGLMAAGVGQVLTNAGVTLSGVPRLIPSRGTVGRYPMRRVNGMTSNGGFPTPARVGNATNSFPTPGRIGSRMNVNRAAMYAAAM